MRVLITSRKWWGRHLVALVAITACAFLGRWQWDKAMWGSGDLVNLGYGLQWWSFAAVIVYGWFRLVREDLHPQPASPDPSGAQESEATASPAFVRPRPAPPALDDDPELAAYNAYLAQLSARSRN